MGTFPGFTGALTINGQSIRFESASITPKQDVKLPDLVTGTYRKSSYNFTKVEVGGSASGPVDELFGDGLWDLAFERGECSALKEAPFSVLYYCNGGGLTVNAGGINSMKLSCTAGEVATWSIDVIGAGYEPTAAAAQSDFAQRKLVTWDAFTVTSPFGDSVQAFEIDVQNNATAVWAMNGNYFPYAIIGGLRMVTGSVTVFDPNGNYGGALDYASASANGAFAISGGGISIDFSGKVAWARIEPKLGVGPFMATYKFTVVEDS